MKGGLLLRVVCMNVVRYERGLLWTRPVMKGGLLWTRSVMNTACYVVCFQRGLFWKWFVLNVVCYERGLLWTWSVMNVVRFERGLLWTWSAMNVVLW